MTHENKTVWRSARRSALNWLSHRRKRQRAEVSTDGNRVTLRFGERTRFFEFAKPPPAYQTFDFAVFALAALAMPRGMPLRFDLPVSESAALAIARLGTVIKIRAPHLASPLDLELTSIVPDTAPGTGKIMCLSGGVDSTHGAMTLDGIDHALMIRGFDFALESASTFNSRREAVMKIAAHFDLQVIDMSTDFSKSLRYFEVYGALYLTTCLSLAGYGLGGGAFSADDARPNQLQQPHHGLTAGMDTHLSTKAFPITLYGDTDTRAGKLKFIHERAPELMSTLGFCPQPGRGQTNCGTCRKCIRTRMCLVQKGIPQETVFQEVFDPLTQYIGVRPNDRRMAAVQLGRIETTIADLPDGSDRDQLIAHSTYLQQKFFGVNVPIDPHRSRS